MPQDDINSLLEEILNKERVKWLNRMLEEYCLSAQSKGKSSNTIAIVEAFVRYPVDFSTDSDFSTA